MIKNLSNTVWVLQDYFFKIFSHLLPLKNKLVHPLVRITSCSHLFYKSVQCFLFLCFFFSLFPIVLSSSESFSVFTRIFPPLPDFPILVSWLQSIESIFKSWGSCLTLTCRSSFLFFLGDFVSELTVVDEFLFVPS